MPVTLKDVINNTVGSNITYVANAYSTSEGQFVWLLIYTDDIELSKLNLTFSTTGTGSLSLTVEPASECTVLRIPYKKFHKYERTRCRERISIISHTQEILVVNYEIPANHSFIITRQGQIDVGKKDTFTLTQTLTPSMP
ncbi:hypothetical protein I4U23_022428 [Adineta vaga]|nr:hypothetical protein I4U23_022428 [Adineta vaga]